MFGLFKRYDVHLCPAVSGRITDNGNPLAGATIKRELVYADNKVRRDTTVTDADGRFSLPERNIRSNLPGNMFAYDRTSQFIALNHMGTEFILWSTIQQGIGKVAEYESKLTELNGDIKSPEVTFSFGENTSTHISYGVRTICRWQEQFEIYEINGELV